MSGVGQVNWRIPACFSLGRWLELLPEIFGKQAAGKMLKPRGRPKTGNARTSISLRLPPDALARWKATGPGWQTRMADGIAAA
jgi:uncharacterized protein (DUF4415 family)